MRAGTGARGPRGAARRRAATRTLAVATLGVLASVRLVTAQCPDGTPPPCGRPAARAAAAPPNSVAVLYFESRTQDTTDLALAAGLASPTNGGAGCSTEIATNHIYGLGRATGEHHEQCRQNCYLLHFSTPFSLSISARGPHVRKHSFFSLPAPKHPASTPTLINSRWCPVHLLSYLTFVGHRFRGQRVSGPQPRSLCEPYQFIHGSNTLASQASHNQPARHALTYERRFLNACDGRTVALAEWRARPPFCTREDITNDASELPVTRDRSGPGPPAQEWRCQTSPSWSGCPRPHRLRCRAACRGRCHTCSANLLEALR